MKHLKLYEYEETEVSKFYMVFGNKPISFNKIQYTIFKVNRYINTDNEYVRLTKLYYYTTDGKLKKINPPDDIGVFIYTRLSSEIIYESPDLQDCIDKLPLLAATSKYNI